MTEPPWKRSVAASPAASIHFRFSLRLRQKERKKKPDRPTVQNRRNFTSWYVCGEQKKTKPGGWGRSKIYFWKRKRKQRHDPIAWTSRSVERPLSFKASHEIYFLRFLTHISALWKMKGRYYFVHPYYYEHVNLTIRCEPWKSIKLNRIPRCESTVAAMKGIFSHYRGFFFVLLLRTLWFPGWQRHQIVIPRNIQSYKRN